MKKLIVLISALILLSGCEQLAQGVATVKKTNGTSTTEQNEKTKHGSGENNHGVSSQPAQTGGTSGGASSGSAASTSGTSQAGSASASGAGSASGSTESAEMITITFDTDGENTPAPITVKKGTLFVDLPQPKRFNREFTGWALRKDALTELNPGVPLQEPQKDMTLYATWYIIDLSIGGASQNYKNEAVFLKGITPPQESDWELVRGFRQENLKTVTWKPGDKWYDTDQFELKLCWAAGASNILHWWLDQNAEYIQRYGDYKGKHEYKGRKTSDLFGYFATHFNNEGNWPGFAMLWYVRGSSTQEGGGFFKDVFKDVELKDNSKFLTRRNFTEMIDGALKHGKGMIFVLSGHAITIWGADFDSEGYVSGLYYVNSTGNADTYRGGEANMFHTKVIYNRINGQLRPCLPGSEEGRYTVISELSTFSLGQDVWKEYLEKHNK